MDDPINYGNHLLAGKMKTMYGPCLKCDSMQHMEKELTISPKVNGKWYRVTAPHWVCIKCGFNCMDGDQMNILRDKVKEKQDEIQKKTYNCRS
jgi:uncharacterized protein (DUF2225 family)